MPRQRGKMLEQVLTVLRQCDQPQSAYSILGKLRQDYPRLTPTSVYRVLAALTDRGTVHRLESMNAYMLCQHRVHHEPCIMAICDDCGHVEERVAPGLIDDLSAETAKSGFAPIRHVIEVHGFCAACAASEKMI